MTNKEMAATLAKELAAEQVTPKFQNQIEVVSGKNTFLSDLILLQKKGWNHLVNILAVDWLKEGKFQVTYQLWSYQLRLHIYVKVFVDREEARVPTALELWPHAQVYEREIHEMFGIRFEGNPDLRPLFLHNWMEIPPMRKNFDTKAYSEKMFSYKGAEKALKEGGEK